MLWYGPGYIKAQGRRSRGRSRSPASRPRRRETPAFHGFKPIDGQPHDRGGIHARRDTDAAQARRRRWCGTRAASNVLEAHPRPWPYLKSLIPQGHLLRARHGGLVADLHRAGSRDDRDRRVPRPPRDRRATTSGVGGQHDLARGTNGPSFLDRCRRSPTSTTGAMGNKPVVGIVGTVDIHFGMLGHGSFFTGGDRDIALTRSVDRRRHAHRRGLRRGTFRCARPPYYKLAELRERRARASAQDVDRVDQADGKLDGKWRDNDIEQLLQGLRHAGAHALPGARGRDA